MTVLSKFPSVVKSWQEAHSKTWSFVENSRANTVTTAVASDESTSRRLTEWLPKMCDVRFQLGESDETIPSVKFSLATHSDVFAAMFFGSGEFKRTMDDTLDGVEIVRVDDCSAEGVRVLNAYVLHFFKEASITASNIGDVLCVADKYAVDGLKQCCDKFIADTAKRNDGDEMVEVLASLNRFNLKDACETALTLFDFAKVFTAEKASKLLPEWILRRILASDELELAERVVFVAAEKWCKKQDECRKDAAIVAETETVQLKDEDIKEESDDCHSDSGGLLKSVLPLIRLPLMDMTFFAKRMREMPELLSAEQKLAVMQNATCIGWDCGFPKVARMKQPFVFGNMDVYWINDSQRRFTQDMTENTKGNNIVIPGNAFWSKGIHSWTVQVNNDNTVMGVGVDVLSEESEKVVSADFVCTYRLTCDGEVRKWVPNDKKATCSLATTGVTFGVSQLITITVDCDKSTVHFNNGHAQKTQALGKGVFYRPLISIHQKDDVVADFTTTCLD